MHKYLLIVSILFSGIAYSQEVNYPEPDFLNKPMYYNHDTKQLEQLEKQVAQTKIKNKFVVIETYYYFTGIKSPFRLNKLSEYKFIIKIEHPDKELDLQLYLYKYNQNSNNDTRELKLSTASAINSKTVNQNISFDYKKLKDDVFLVIAQGLEPGEYGFATTSATYLFGIDQ